jgi:hypothetical protein
MMSAAILVAMGAEPTGVRPASSDLSSDQAKGVSFAKSFNERVGDSDLFRGKSSADGAAIALPSLKNAALVKTPNEVFDMPAGMKGKAILTQEVSAHDELKSAVAAKTAQPHAQPVTGLQVTKTVGDSGAKEIESSAQVEKTPDDVSVDPGDPYAAPVARLEDDNPVPLVSIADGNRPVVSSGGNPVVQKETSNSAKEKEVVSAKKTAEPRDSAAMPKPVQKTVGAASNTATIEAKPAVLSSTESTISSAVAPVAARIVPQIEIGKPTEGLSEAASVAARPSIGVAPVTVDGSARKESARGVKAGIMESEPAVTAADENIAPPKPSADLEKTASVVIPVRNDGDSKMQSAPGPATATVHAMSGVAGISPGFVSGVVVPGNAPGDLIAAKLPVGDVNAHQAGLPAGSREQDGPGLVAASMDGMPRMVTATSTALEVGIPSGTHGWLKVRAEMADGGVINASVSAASSSGQEMLHRELPSLTAYLQQEKVAVNTVVVHTATAEGVELRGSGSGMNSGGGEQTPQKSNEGGEQRQDVGKGALDRLDEAMGHQEDGEDGLSPLAMYAGGGSWLSVRA